MLNIKKIAHIADLAKLNISETEAKQYAKELSKVLDYVEELEKVDVAKVEPTAQVTGQVNRLRVDRVKPWNEEERLAALSLAKTDDRGLVKSDKILSR